MAKNELDMDFEFDFGFTAVNEDELDVAQKAVTATQAASSAEDRLNKLYNAILPLLSNLKKNPEKDYIYWPKRVDKVEEFEDHISKIMNS